jgi:DNA-directed RNA polymerase specialized sigma24 family protein
VTDRIRGFPLTRYSVIERMRNQDAETRREAFGDLVQGYWKPLYIYLRLHWRVSHDEAQELTQAFFSEAYQKEWLARYEPDKAKFRTFVRMCADRFVMNSRQAASRLKRGGGAEVLSLDFPSAEQEVARHQLVEIPDAEEFFRAEFVRTLFERAVAEVRAEYLDAGREVPLALFERYDLDPEEGVSYASLASEFGLTQSQVTNTLAAVRRSFRAKALETLRTLCGSPEEFRREARELFGVEVE